MKEILKFSNPLRLIPLFSLTCLTVLFSSLPAKAALLTWGLDNVRFNDGAFAVGGFQYNADTNQLGNIDISVLGGFVFPSFNYRYSGFVTDFDGSFSLADPFFSRGIQLVFFPFSLTNAGGVVPINNRDGFSFEATCTFSSCFTSPARFISTGTVRAVTLPTDEVDPPELDDTPSVPEPQNTLALGIVAATSIGAFYKRQTTKDNQ